MGKEIKVLFGVDSSEFAREAVAAAANLLKDNRNLEMTIFHGIPEPDPGHIFEPSLSPEEVEKHLQLWSRERQKVIRLAKEAAIDAGFDSERANTSYEERCKDPVISMINLANKENFGVIALARWGARTLAKKVMGHVTYKLMNMAYHLPLWIIDPRIASHNLLITVVGAGISRRVVDHTIRYFSHLKESKFTLFHVIPPLAPELHTTSYWDIIRDLSGEEQQENMAQRMEAYLEKAKSIAKEGKERLISAGIPEDKVVVKFQPQKEGIARDILVELEEGNYGILVLGRKGVRDITQFGLGSKANKLIHTAHAFMVCLVN
ncbi:MAG: universal stress protein [Deltaproteobacteria bacterium]|nr:universal stress protein [Deltaproteobacteria bacterium]